MEKGMKSDMINDLMKIPDVKGDEMIYNSYNEKWNDDICLFGTKRSPMEIFLSRKCWGDDQEDQEGFKDGVADSLLEMPVVLRNGSLLLTHILHVIGFLPREVSQFN